MGLFASLKRLAYLDGDLNNLFDASITLEGRLSDAEDDIRLIETVAYEKKGATPVTKKPVKKGKK